MLLSPFSRLSRSGFAHCRQSFAAAGGLLFPRPLALIISYCGENATHFVSKTDFRRLKRRLDSHSIILLRILYKFSTRRNRTRERKNAKDASLQMPRSAAHGFPAARRMAPALWRLLCARGVDTPQAAQDFLHPDASQIADPFTMPGMREAVERIQKAVDRTKPSSSTAITTWMACAPAPFCTANCAPWARGAKYTCPRATPRDTA